MNRALKSFLAAAALLLPSAAYANEYVFSGKWQQVASNAGQCSSCTITIIRQGTLMTVTANNGWSAVLRNNLSANARFAEGTGQWRANADSAYDNAPFHVTFVLKDDKLHMRMLARIKNNTTQWIKAVFDRPIPAKEKRGLPQALRINFPDQTDPIRPVSSATGTRS